MAATAYSYVISLFVRSQLAAVAATALVQVLIVALFFVGCMLTNLNAPATQLYAWLNYLYYTMALIAPIVSLFRALMMSVNLYSLVCRGATRADYPGQISIYGGPILYLTLQIVVLVAFLMFWESGRSLEVFGIRSKARRSRTEAELEKGDAAARYNNAQLEAAEDDRHLAASNDGLRVSNISKSFGQNKAVDEMNFGILPSEKFALLGPNGAGKSTLISLIRGDLKPDHGQGEVFIANESLMHSPVAARNQLGVCPQFDAIDAMTLRENLSFYARARGVPDENHNITELIARLDLTPHQHKLVKKLSGGTKRKLSLAIALISNPNVLLLDEPSSGMDPAAKRALWSTLRDVSVGRVLLMTTHSMEEADALCDRAGIMAGKMLALDSVEGLRGRFGDKVYVHLVHKDAPYASNEDTMALRRWVQNKFPGAEVEQQTFGGQIRFAVSKDSTEAAGVGGASGPGNDAGRLFRVIEDEKDTLGVVDYSIGPATLDQVFLNVVERHNVLEENAEAAKPGAWTLQGLRRRKRE
ncbi:hypothetical protein LTR37_009355 [Vermiconidia calcicola]|uniref:Uncharacterized protein n=1 Tax=Vermiconidia calcicola TaxID=1690605 RepID=A0ACC3N7Q3_9PEZI|nr:hypothetical protein LTR37_009355 [Vermiconidia calcicola]